MVYSIYLAHEWKKYYQLQAFCFTCIELHVSGKYHNDTDLSKHLIASSNSFIWYREFPFIYHELKLFDGDRTRDLSKHLIATSYDFLLYNDNPIIYQWSAKPHLSDIINITFKIVFYKAFDEYWLILAFIAWESQNLFDCLKVHSDVEVLVIFNKQKDRRKKIAVLGLNHCCAI